jgi:lipoate-protein ligase A
MNSGWDLVRRPTGGRAILHTDELTYAVIGPADEPRLAGSILESYQRLAAGLQIALERLALPAQSQAAGGPTRKTDQFEPVCFEIPGNYEITVDGKKLVGSAQARKKAGVLQHGTLPLSGDLTRITRVLKYPTQAAREKAGARLLEKATTVEGCLDRQIAWEDAAAAICGAFEETLNLTLVPGELTKSERDLAVELVSIKYSNPVWTERI